jgi:uncharacterized protein (TIGR02611 family)
MEGLKRRWKRVPTPIRKPLVLIIGAAIIAGGLAMLILPGPGWAAIFLGFAVLATEFAFAERVRAWAVEEAKRDARKLHRAWKNFIRRFKRSQ